MRIPVKKSVFLEKKSGARGLGEGHDEDEQEKGNEERQRFVALELGEESFVYGFSGNRAIILPPGREIKRFRRIFS